MDGGLEGLSDGTNDGKSDGTVEGDDDDTLVGSMVGVIVGSPVNAQMVNEIRRIHSQNKTIFTWFGCWLNSRWNCSRLQRRMDGWHS